MDFFNSLSLDLKVLVVCGLGCVLLAMFSGDKNREKKYILLFTIFMLATVVRFNQTINAGAERPARARTVSIR